MADPDQAEGPFEARQYLQETYLRSGLLDPDKVVGGYALDARFLRDQIDRSRQNLRIETLDLYLVEEPERHLRSLGPSGFRRRLVEVFEALEGACLDGAIGAYGIATWDGFLVPASERDHLAAVDVFEAAIAVGGGDHHMRAVQLPYGMASGEGAVLDSQLGPDGKRKTILATLQDTGTMVLGSAPLFGGRVLGHIPDFVRRAFPEAAGDAQLCLQFARSSEGITSSVVGMRDPDHVEQNLELCHVPPAKSEVPAELLRGA